MKIIDVSNPERINKKPDKMIVLFSGANYIEQQITVKKVLLCQYIQNNDHKLGPFSLITVKVETDIGEIEMTYDEGYKGQNALDDSAKFLTANLGLSSLILRSILQLKIEIARLDDK